MKNTKQIKRQVPTIHKIEQIPFRNPKLHRLDNGIPVYELPGGTQPVIKVEIALHAGRLSESSPLISRATNLMLKEGTRHASASEIAEKLDAYGSNLSLPYSLDYGGIVMYMLSKHATTLIPLLAELVTQPAFDERELQIFIQRQKAALEVELAKNEVVAYRVFTEALFGENHPYGYNTTLAHYDVLTSAKLRHHHDQHYHANNCQVFISGDTQAVVPLLNQYFGQWEPKEHSPIPYPKAYSGPKKEQYIDHENHIQTAIQLGMRLFSRQHEDFPGMYVLTTLLGGYFGSRLMKNIREDKGYTYHIEASLDTMKNDGFWQINTESSPEYVPEILEEVSKEIESLGLHPIPEEELQMVQQYLMGQLLTWVDGPFNHMDLIKVQVLEELPQDYFSNLTKQIKALKSMDIQQLAQKYLCDQDFHMVVVGKS